MSTLTPTAVGMKEQTLKYDYTFTDFADDAGLDEVSVLNYLSKHLPGHEGDWTVSLSAPTDYSPAGRLHLIHPKFDESTSIILDSTRGPTGRVRFDVRYSLQAEIKTEVENIGFTTAVRAAQRVAKREWRSNEPQTESKDSVVKTYLEKIPALLS